MRERPHDQESYSEGVVLIGGNNRLARINLAQILTSAGYQVAASVNLDQLDQTIEAYPEAAVAVLPTHIQNAAVEALSPRERQVVALAAQGLPDKAIADTMEISARTVRFHMEGAMRKLGAHNRTEAVAKVGASGRFL